MDMFQNFDGILEGCKPGDYFMTKNGPAKVFKTFKGHFGDTVDMWVNESTRIYEMNGTLNRALNIFDSDDYKILHFMSKEDYPEYYL